MQNWFSTQPGQCLQSASAWSNYSTCEYYSMLLNDASESDDDVKPVRAVYYL
jgi:hypothetical protein